MLLNFVKINPSGNTTVYILDPLPRKYYPKIAQKLLCSSNIGCEQVGFLEKSLDAKEAYRLQMAGGEFCGNAARGLAAWLSYRNYPYSTRNDQGQTIVPLEVSGTDNLLEVDVADLNYPHKKYARIAMPIPISVNEYYIKGEIGHFKAVNLGGITHAVLLGKRPDQETFFLVKQKLEQEMGELEAIGVMFYEEKEKLTPIVYVKELDSLVWERSCGSGSVAVGCVRALKEQGTIKGLKLDQPGGALIVDILWEKGIKAAHLAGDIEIIAEGTLFVDLSE